MLRQRRRLRGLLHGAPLLPTGGTVRYYRARYSQEEFGTVDAVMGDALRISGLRRVRVSSAIVFRSGAIAIATDLHHDGTVHACLVSGSVQPPGGVDLLSSAAELAGELTKSGLSTGGRLLKDVFARLPLN